MSGRAQFAAVFRAAFHDADLRRVELAFMGFGVAEYSTWVAVLVYAYEIGGTTLSGVMGAIQLLSAAVFAPFASSFGDRYSRDRVLLAGYLVQAVSTGLAGIAMVRGAPFVVVAVLATAAAATVTLTRPIQWALLPELARTPSELIASNVVAAWADGVGALAGPLLAGVLLTFSVPGSVFLAMSGVFLCSALLTAPVRTPQRRPSAASSVYGHTPGTGLWEGFRVIVTERHPRLVVSLMSANFLLVGAMDVLLVVLAIQLLRVGAPGAGYLTTAFGVGGLGGAIAATLLASRRHLAPVLFGAGLAWFAGLALVALMPSRGLVAVLIVVAGTGKPLIDVVGRILLQRVVRDGVLSRVLGALEGLSMAAAALGSILVPMLVALLNTSVAFVAFGVLLPLLTLVFWQGLRQLDATHDIAEERVPMVRSLTLFAPLPVPTMLRIAGLLVPTSVTAGTVIIREGERGDRFYIIRDGRVSVSIGGRLVRTLGAGDFFGEIALLRDIPRTATVTADETTSLYALDRRNFLEAVTGHAQSMEAVHVVARNRLGEVAVEDV